MWTTWGKGRIRYEGGSCAVEVVSVYSLCLDVMAEGEAYVYIGTFIRDFFRVQRISNSDFLSAIFSVYDVYRSKITYSFHFS